MRLPIAIQHDGKVYTDVSLKSASAMDIASVKKAGENGDIYSAFLQFAIVHTAQIEDVDDSAQIRAILHSATFESIYTIALFGMALTRGIDSIEGRYKCSCGAIIEHTGQYADKLSDLPYDSTQDSKIVFELPEAVTINTKTEIEVKTITMQYPIIDTLIRAFHKYPDDDSSMQFEVYKNSLLQINGRDIDTATRGMIGDLVFKKMSYQTTNKLTKELTKYGIGSIEVVCMKCKKRFKTPLDLTSFFGLEAE